MKKRGFTTSILHGDRQKPIEHGSLHKPVHTSIAYAHKTTEDITKVFQGIQAGYTYSRQINPTVTALEEKITAMESGKQSLCFASGMAAISAVMLTLLKKGDHLVSSSFLFGNTNSFFSTLENFGIEVSFVDATDAANVAAEIRENTKMVFVETIANPRTHVVDLQKVGELCRQHDLVYVVDNTMTSPFLYQPKDHGASLVINSLSKYICGHGNALGGSVTETGNFDWTSFGNIIESYRTGNPQKWGLQQVRKKGLRDQGGTLSPQAAHIIAVGSETLALRMQTASENASRLAHFFDQHELVKAVFYPGMPYHEQHSRAGELFKSYGALMSIELQDSVDCYAFLDKMELGIISTNLGDNRTLALPVAPTIYHEMGPEKRKSMGVGDGLVRLSIGIENYQDLQNDFEQALNKL